MMKHEIFKMLDNLQVTLKDLKAERKEILKKIKEEDRLQKIELMIINNGGKVERIWLDYAKELSDIEKNIKICKSTIRRLVNVIEIYELADK